ncbi:MAG: KpsF/GutQ family sugar-phosphate isomerase [Gammaproteobacteria bacterium]|nr:KpsF/GutQ family sugar-phosphate isomerase [Gammaproteobacteria bacterium]
MTTYNFNELGKAVLKAEAESVVALIDRLGDEFQRACELMLACEGRIVVIGMGKSGHIGGKIAATLASTGSPAFFVHPGEASHGDLGMITAKDVVLALSNSGETGEILTILPLIKRLAVPLISLTGNPESMLATSADVNIDVSVTNEACPLNLAPTSSTTATLAMGDALAIALLEVKGFTAEDFALSHPGGSLGRRLLLHVEQIMHTGDAIPAIQQDALLGQALLEITQKSLGMTAIIDDQNTIIGIFTDGDLRRTLDQGLDMHNTPIKDIMTVKCKVARQDMLAAEALQIMDEYKINALLVENDQHKLVGALNMHDLLRAGVV